MPVITLDREKVLADFILHNDRLEKRNAEGIEKYRKGDAVITLVDKEGNPINGAKVKAVHKKHEFKFGANLFMLDELETEEKNEKYKKYFSELFNKVMGMNLREYVNRLRINVADNIKNENPNISLREISERVGYNSWVTFHRAYSKYSKYKEK